MEVFEYESPLMNPEPRVFQFVSADDPNYDNPWKESFKQLVGCMFLFLEARGLKQGTRSSLTKKLFRTFTNALIKS